MARPRRGDLEGLERNGEFDGVSFSRLLQGVVAISVPLTHVEWTEEAGDVERVGYHGDEGEGKGMVGRCSSGLGNGKIE
jgi:hypothetical protein